jgi:outer membrane lipoprotein
MKALALLSGLLLFLGGCAHVLSKEALYEVDPVLEYAQVKADPKAYRGKALLLGGLIVDHKLSREESTLEVLRYSLDRYGEPIAVDEEGGRFLVRSERFLDPELYKAGLLITLTGTVLGRETHPLKGVDYTYPVFLLGQAHLWSRQPYYYDPFYGPYDPYWYPYGPFWYPPYRYPRFR